MTERLDREDKKPLPLVTAATAGLIALANWQGGNKIVNTLTAVRSDATWLEWAYRWPGSFFKASPFFGKLGDTALSMGLIAATLGHTEREEGAGRALKVAAIGQAIGCAATRAAAVTGFIPTEQMHDLDVGSSSAAAALVGNWATRWLREQFPTQQARTLAMGIGAAGIVSLGLVDPSVTDMVGHLAPYAYGVWEGGRKPLNPQRATAATTV